MNNITIVTGLWNINRKDRSFESYMYNFKKLLEIEQNLYIYIPKDLEYIVWENRKSDNTIVKILELEDIKNNYYSPFWDNTQKIRNSPKWKNQAGWLKESPQSCNEWYNAIVQSKMFMLHDVKILDPFNTDYFMWVDAGLTNTVNSDYLKDNKFWNNVHKYIDSFLFLSFPYNASNEIHGFEYSKMNELSGEKVRYVCRGGMFGGHKSILSTVNEDYYNMLSRTLSEGYMGTEESIFTIMSYIDPELYRRYSLDENGFVFKFVENVIKENIDLERNIVPRPKSYDKVSLYILTYNSPNQLQHLLNSFYDDWLKKPRLILLDNSTDNHLIEENKKIATKYNFEYIGLEGNKGICGGRLFAAEHFNKSDSDLYMFFEDDMTLCTSKETGVCKNGFRKYIPNLYNSLIKIMNKENYDFLKLSFTEVYFDNNIQVSWYNIPERIRLGIWGSGIKKCPLTKFNNVKFMDGLGYIDGEIYYCNWPLIMNKEGNKKIFIDQKWEHPYEQTWMSFTHQEIRKGNIRSAVLLLSPINHDRIIYYPSSLRREN